MMSFKDFLSLLPPKVPVHGRQERRALRRKAAGLAANGNVLVQFGRFVTKDDLDERKKVLFKND